MARITVLVADDHPVVRQGITAVLKANPDMEVVGEAEDGFQAIEAAKRLRPEVVVLDLAMPVMNGIMAARHIIRTLPQTRILVLTSYAQEHYIREALKAGASGYVLKQSASEELGDAVRAVSQRQNYFSPRVAAILGPRRKSLRNPKRSLLSLREGQVLQLIAEGYTNSQIGKELGMAARHVRATRDRLMKKLQLKSDGQLKAAGLRLEAF